MNRNERIAVIGAGMAGLACAKALRRKGAAVTVFDKSRGLGGRLASRRGDGVQFDHGAQYISARTPGFTAFMEACLADGAAALWRPDIHDGRESKGGSDKWYVGLPGMSGLVKPLADGIDVKLSHTATSLRRKGEEWALGFQEGTTEQVFRTVVLAIPAEQARSLLRGFAGAFPELHAVATAPCLAAMAAFDEPAGLSFDARRFNDGPLAWVARNSSKPSRPTALEQWVFHAAPEWSRVHLEHDKHDIAARIMEEARHLFGPLPVPSHLSGHRWRYAFVEKAAGTPCLFDPALRLGLAGDWCIGPRVEAAYESGLALAERIA